MKGTTTLIVAVVIGLGASPSGAEAQFDCWTCIQGSCVTVDEGFERCQEFGPNCNLIGPGDCQQLVLQTLDVDLDGTVPGVKAREIVATAASLVASAGPPPGQLFERACGGVVVERIYRPATVARLRTEMEQLSI